MEITFILKPLNSAFNPFPSTIDTLAAYFTKSILIASICTILPIIKQIKQIKTPKKGGFGDGEGAGALINES